MPGDSSTQYCPSSFGQQSSSFNRQSLFGQPTTSSNQPTTPFNHTSSLFNQPTMWFNQPSSLFNQPTTRLNQPSSSFNLPVISGTEALWRTSIKRCDVMGGFQLNVTMRLFWKNSLETPPKLESKRRHFSHSKTGTAMAASAVPLPPALRASRRFTPSSYKNTHTCVLLLQGRLKFCIQLRLAMLRSGWKTIYL